MLESQPIVESENQITRNSLLAILLALLLFSVGLNIFLLTKQPGQSFKPNNQKQVVDQTVVAPTQVAPPTSIKENVALISLTKEILLSIPNGIIIKQPIDGDFVWSAKKIIDKFTVKINNQTYTLGINGGGLCPWDPGNPEFVDETNCGYTDKVLNSAIVNIPTFRVWKDNRGVFALNPQSIIVNGKYVDFFVIQKDSPTASFSASEIAMWENMLLEGLQ